MNILKNILFGLVLLLGIVGSSTFAGGGNADFTGTAEGMSVAEFVSAYYDVYVIDTSGAEPTVQAIIATNGDFSELEAMGVSTNGTVFDTVYAHLPIHLIDSVRQLPSVIRLRFLTWDERIKGTYLSGHTSCAIDTTGAEPMIDVTIRTTTGDLSELQAMGIGTGAALTNRSGGKTIPTRIPIRRMGEIAALPSVKSVAPAGTIPSPGIKFYQENYCAIEGQVRGLPPGARYGLGVNLVKSEESYKNWFRTDDDGTFVINSLDSGLYTCTFRLLVPLSVTDEQTGDRSADRTLCDSVVIEDILVPEDGAAKNVIVDFGPRSNSDSDAPGGNDCDPCRTTWKEVP